MPAPRTIPMPEMPPPRSGSELQRLAYSPGETAELLGVSRMTVYRLMDSGALKSRKIGSARRILSSSIIEYIEAGDR
jgi:excisionase family DNA binding protein